MTTWTCYAHRFVTSPEASALSRSAGLGSTVTWAVTGTCTVYCVDQYIVDKLGKEYKKHRYAPPEATKEFFGKYEAPPDKPKAAPAEQKKR